MRISLYKRKLSKDWTYVIQYQDPITKEVRTKHIGKIPKKDAQLIKDNLKVELIKKKFDILNEKQSIKLSELLKRFIDSIKLDRSSATVQITTSATNKFIELMGDPYIDKINLSILENWRNKRKNYGRILKDKNGNEYRGTVKATSINIEYRHLKAMFNYAIKHELLESNPFKFMKQLKVDKKVPPVLPIEDIKKFLSSIDNLLERYYFTLLYYTGARPSEIAKLTPKQIKDDYIELIDTKGNKDRLVYVPKLLIDKIRPLTYNLKDNEVIFKNFHGKSYKPSKRMAKLIENAGLSKNYTPKWFRHTFSTLATQVGKDIYAVKEVLGHSDVSTTQNYTHYNVENQKSIIDNLPSLD